MSKTLTVSGVFLLLFCACSCTQNPSQLLHDSTADSRDAASLLDAPPSDLFDKTTDTTSSTDIASDAKLPPQCDRDLPQTSNLVGPVSWSDLEKAVTAAAASTTIVLKNGTYKTPVVLKGNGQAGKPIIVKAKTPGSVIVTGLGRITLSGSHIALHGFDFSGGSLDPLVEPPANIVRMVCTGCRLTNSKIRNATPSTGNTLQWVRIVGGKNNRIDHCEIHTKDNFGEMVRVTQHSPGPHRIDHNYFHDFIRVPPDNGGEVIRVGSGDLFNLKKVAAYIEDNYFLRIRSESEITSIKAGGSIIRRNTFEDCYFMVTLRTGNDSEVSDNIFVVGAKLTGGGVRVCGQRHKILNNHFHGVSTGIRLCAGHAPGTCQYGYEPSHDAVVTGNRFSNVNTPIDIDYRLGQTSPSNCPKISTAAKGMTLKNNQGAANIAGAYSAQHPCIGTTW